MAMLKALVRGDATCAEMAKLAKKRLRQKLRELELALEGRVEEPHRFVLEIQLSRLEEVDKHIAKLDERMDSKTACVDQLPDWSRVFRAPCTSQSATRPGRTGSCSRGRRRRSHMLDCFRSRRSPAA